MFAIKTMRVGISARDAAWGLTSGLLGAAAFPPLGLWPLSFVSLYLFLRTMGSKNSAEGRIIGLVYGFAFAFGTMYWLFGLFGFYAIVLIVIMADYFLLLGGLIGLTHQWPAYQRALAVAVFAMGVEWFRGDAWYLRFPWYTPPHALAQAPAWIAASHWLGTYGLSGLIWGITAWAALAKKIYYALLLMLLPVCSFLLPEFDPPNLSAVLVQCEQSSKLEPLLSTIPAEHVDLVVLPEYAYPYGIDGALTSKQGPVALAKRLGCPVIFGTVEGSYGEPDFQNVAAVLDAEGHLLGTFPKQRPVPLMIDGRPGNRRPMFPFSFGTLGIGLCYDFDASAVAGSLTTSGATVLVAPTGDLMPWGRVQHVHHELLVRLRAVENDRWILRATTSGQILELILFLLANVLVATTCLLWNGFKHLHGPARTWLIVAMLLVPVLMLLLHPPLPWDCRSDSFAPAQAADHAAAGVCRTCGAVDLVGCRAALAESGHLGGRGAAFGIGADQVVGHRRGLLPRLVRRISSVLGAGRIGNARTGLRGGNGFHAAAKSTRDFSRSGGTCQIFWRSSVCCCGSGPPRGN